MNKRRAISGFLLSFVFLLFFSYMVAGAQWVFSKSLKDSKNEVSLGDLSGAVQNVTAVAPVPVKPDISAKAAISIESNLYDINKIIFEKDAGVQLPIASLTKLMTAVVVLDNYNLSDIIYVSKIADMQDPMKQDVKFGDKMTVENFLDIMLVGSSNKSAYALSEKIGEPLFVNLMNQKAEQIGLQNTVFTDPTGLSSGDVSTASDLVKLAEYILNNKNYSKIPETTKLKILNVPGFGEVENTDGLLDEISNIVCSKTGFTTAASGCLLLVTNNPKNNDYIISVILGSEDRFSEMEKLVNWSNITCNQ